MTRRGGTGGLVAVLVVASASAALGAWTSPASGTATATSAGMPQGVITGPSTGAVAAPAISVTWQPGFFVGPVPAAPVAGYTVKRYLAGQPDPTALSPGCSGVRTGTSCTDTVSSAGAYSYTVTPVSGSWIGTESAASGTVTYTAPDVEGPTVVSVSSADGDGIAEVGDVITIGFSEPVTVSRASGTLTLSRPNNGNAVMSITDVTDGDITLPGGAFFLDANGSKKASFGVSVTAASSTVTVTLTSASTKPANDPVAAGPSGSVVVKPSSSITDVAGNPARGSFTTPSLRMF